MLKKPKKVLESKNAKNSPKKSKTNGPKKIHNCTITTDIVFSMFNRFLPVVTSGPTYILRHGKDSSRFTAKIIYK